MARLKLFSKCCFNILYKWSQNFLKWHLNVFSLDQLETKIQLPNTKLLHFFVVVEIQQKSKHRYLAKYLNFLFSKNQTFLGIICEMNKILTGTSKILSFRCDLTTGLFRDADSILDTAEYIC